eukprot:6028512-Amphidinium_carterae.2
MVSHMGNLWSNHAPRGPYTSLSDSMMAALEPQGATHFAQVLRPLGAQGQRRKRQATKRHPHTDLHAEEGALRQSTATR